MKSTKKELIYPVFLKCSHSHPDPFWQYVFEDLAYGISPFGTFFDHETGTIQCNFKGKEFNYAFHQKSSEEVCTELIDLFRRKLQLLSRTDYLHQRSVLGEHLKFSFQSWKDIKKKNIKDILLEEYILSTQENVLSARKFLSLIQMALHFKLITNDDIVFDSKTNRVVQIHHFDVKQGIIPSFSFSYNLNKQETEEKSSKLDVYSMWRQFIQ